MTSDSAGGSRSGAVRRPGKTSDLLARQIIRLIRREGLSTGDRLPNEAEMIEEYQVGRGTLREALRILEVNGFISIKPGPGGGPIVESPSAEKFGRMAALFYQVEGMTYREVVQARLIMEPMAARLAAEQQRSDAPSDGLKRLAAIRNFRDDDEYFEHSLDFHATVITLSRNRIFELFCQSLSDVFRERVSSILFPEDRRQEVVSSHKAIASAISSGNGTRAHKLMREHMEAYAEFVFERHPAIMDEVIEWR